MFRSKKLKRPSKKAKPCEKRKATEPDPESEPATESKLTLKLVVDSNSKRVLFAEAGKDFTDFLFRLLSLPVGTVISLSTKTMVGTLGKLYDSFEELNDTYIQPNVNKDTLLNPKSCLGSSPTTIHSLTNGTETTTSKMIYVCPNGCYYWDDESTEECPTCGEKIDGVTRYVGPPSTKKNVRSTEEEEVGFVKGVVTYVVMDDLEVKPFSTISSIEFLSRFNFEEVGALQEKIVSVGMSERLELLKASLETTSVLTKVFLK